MTFDTLVEQFATMTFYCYTQDEAIHGVIALQKDDEETGRIANLYVLPTTQRHGIGTALMRYAHEEARARGLRRLRLHVVEQATWATSFYRKLGYACVKKLERPEGRVLVMETPL